MIHIVSVEIQSIAPSISRDQVVQFRDPVRRFVGARVRNDAMADDLTQEIFLRVIKQLPRVNDPRRVVGWVFQIARHAVADHFRSFKASEIYHDETELLPQRPDVVQQEESELRDRLSSYVREVVKGLPPLYREALLLTQYEGMTQVELAKHLGITISGAKSRVQRARQMVRTIIEQCCHVEFDRYGTLVECRPRAACECARIEPAATD